MDGKTIFVTVREGGVSLAIDRTLKVFDVLTFSIASGLPESSNSATRMCDAATPAAYVAARPGLLAFA
jgi:hypothetical protein